MAGVSLPLEEHLMTTLLFQELTQQLEEELHRLHYTEASIVHYRRMWKRIACFFEQEGINHFSEEAGMRFLDEQFNFFEREQAGQLTQSIINVFRIVRMLGDFQQHGSILRRYYKQKDLLQTDELKTVLQGYQAHCQQSAYAKVTQKHYRTIAERFLSFLESQDIRQPADRVARHL
jgi:integrase/recombinase XerD